MNPSDRTKEALLARTETLCNAIYDERNPDPWGGDGYLSTILRTVKPADTSEYSTIPKISEAKDFYTSAQKELTVREQTAGLIKTTQDLSTLIRDLQELWLFGGLDTLSDPADEEANQAKAVRVAEIIEGLAGSRKFGGEKEKDEDGVNGTNGGDVEIKKEG